MVRRSLLQAALALFLAAFRQWIAAFLRGYNSMADAAYESWVGSDTIINGQASGSSWDIVQLGQVFLPGVVTIENLEVGRDIDVQKRKKKEKARIRDNGLSPVTFDIIVELTGRQWADWLKILPAIQPKEGVPRQAFEIVHPMVNAYNVNSIYIHKIKAPAPSARKGMRVEIHCGEWMEEEVDTKAPTKKDKKSLQSAYGKPDYFGDPAQLAKQLSGNQGFVEPGGVDNAMSNAFGADPPATKSPGEAGWHGFKGNSTAKQPPPAPKQNFGQFGVSRPFG